jgi:hypothetical protein
MPRKKTNMVRTIIAILILSIPLCAYASEIKWDESSTVRVDFNCDGTPDTAKLGYIENRVRLTIIFGGGDLPSQSIEFGLGMSGYQDALCGTDAKLSIEDMDYDLIEIFGENPEGFEQSKTCSGLNIRAGDCDSMHIFWNHKTNHIDWWRL